MHEQYSGLSDTDIKMLAITAIMVVFFESKDLIKMEKLDEVSGSFFACETKDDKGKEEEMKFSYTLKD